MICGHPPRTWQADRPERVPADRGDRPRVRAAALAMPRRGKAVPVTHIVISQRFEQGGYGMVHRRHLPLAGVSICTRSPRQGQDPERRAAQRQPEYPARQGPATVARGSFRWQQLHSNQQRLAAHPVAMRKSRVWPGPVLTAGQLKVPILASPCLPGVRVPGSDGGGTTQSPLLPGKPRNAGKIRR